MTLKITLILEAKILTTNKDTLLIILFALFSISGEFGVGTQLSFSYRLHSGQHRRSGLEGRNSSPGARTPLANHKNRPVR